MRQFASPAAFCAAVDTRLGDRARSSVDMDLDHAQGATAAREDLLRALAEDLGDYFTFAVTGTEEVREGDVRALCSLSWY
ncbi:MAG: hypothetical protein ACT4P5_22655 [Armatimonadota bacterium]